MPSSASSTSPAAATPTYVDITFSSTPDQPDPLIGPPNWNQLVYIGGGYPYYLPNSDLVEAILLLIICLVISFCAALVLRRARRRGDAVSLTKELLTFKYFWSAMLFSIITYGYALIDDAIHIGSTYVQQRYFLVHFIFNAFDYAGRIFLLFTIYALVFRLMRNSPVGNGWLSTVHFRRYEVVRGGLCILLGILAVLNEGFSLAYLTGSIFSSGDMDNWNEGNTAFSAELAFDLLYFLAALEVLVVSCRLVSTSGKNRMFSRKTKIANLIIVSVPLFVAAVARILGVFGGSPPFALYPTSDDSHGYRNTLIWISDIFGPLGMLCSLYGVVYVAANADASINRALISHEERRASLDVVLMDRDPGAVHTVPAGFEV